MCRAAFHARAIPVRERGFFGAAGFAPARHQATVLALVYRHDSKSRQPQNPRPIASRSHPSSLVGCTSTENTIQFRMARGIAFVYRPPSRPPTPSAVRAGGRVLPQIAVLKSVNSPLFRAESASPTVSLASSRIGQCRGRRGIALRGSEGCRRRGSSPDPCGRAGRRCRPG